MTIDETIKVITQGIRYYESDLGIGFSLLEYYAFTDIEPAELAKLTHKNKLGSTAATIVKFRDRNFWNSINLNVEETINLYHSINNKELSKNDKKIIIETLDKEGYPLLDGIYRIAARYYVNFGVESILKENVRERVLGKKYHENYSAYYNPTLASEDKKLVLQTKKK